MISGPLKRDLVMSADIRGSKGHSPLYLLRLINCHSYSSHSPQRRYEIRKKSSELAATCTASVVDLNSSGAVGLYSDGLFADNDISSTCSAAINATIACDPYLLALTEADSFGALNDTSLQSSICRVSCGGSLTEYHNKVTTACAQDPQPWNGVPAVWAGDAIWATYNRTCLKDPSTGKWCSGITIPELLP